MARRIGARGLLVKAADGTDPWPQWTGAAAQARAAGLEAVPWSYCYGDPDEIDVLVATGEPLVCVDPEAHFEAAPAGQRRRWVERLRSAGVRVWSCVEARPEYHAGIPYDDLAGISEAMVPMVAWQVWEPRLAAHWLDEWDTQGYRGFPWLSAEGVTPDELAASVDLAMKRYGGASVWAAHVLTGEQVEALATRHHT